MSRSWRRILNRKIADLPTRHAVVTERHAEAAPKPGVGFDRSPAERRNRRKRMRREGRRQIEESE